MYLGIAMGHKLDGEEQGFDSRKFEETIFFLTASRSYLGPTQPPTEWSPGDLNSLSIVFSLSIRA
jgi:hypothetical protein